MKRKGSVMYGPTKTLKLSPRMDWSKAIATVNTLGSLASKLFGGSSSAPRNNGTVSQYRTQTTTYRKRRRRFNKRAVRRWRKFRRNVRKVMSGDLGKQIIFKSNVQQLANASNKQDTQAVVLGGANGTNDDLMDVLKSAMPNAGGNTAAKENVKVYLRSMQMDCTFRAGGEGSDQQQEVDLYECICQKDLPSGLYGSVQSLLQTGYTQIGDFTNTVLETGTASSIDYETYGATPFENREFCKYFKIVKVTKHLIGPASPFTYTVKMSKNVMLPLYGIAGFTACKGITRVLVAVTSGIWNGTSVPQVTLHIHANRIFRWTQSNRSVAHQDVDTIAP